MSRSVLSAVAAASLLLSVSASVRAQPPIRLDAGAIEIEDHSPALPAAERHGPRPSSVLERWAHERLAVTGNGPPVHFTILDASVIMEKLPIEHGFSATFKDQQDRKLTAHLKARLDYVAPRHTATAIAEAEASMTVAQSASLDELDADYAKVLGLAADGFDRQMTDETHARFGDLIVRGL